MSTAAAPPRSLDRAERAAVRALAAEVDAARLALARGLPARGGDLDARAGQALAALWTRRFAGLPVPAQDEAVARLLDRPCDAALARRLVQAHELGRARVLARRGREVVLEPSPARRRHGVYYTPEDVVAFIVRETLPDPRPEARVLDPACGGGAFLLGALPVLAAAQRARGAPRPAAAALLQLHGVDLDPGALALCELALRATAAELDGTPFEAQPRPRLTCGDALALFARGEPVHDAVVGNPPYATPSAEQAALAARAGLRAAAAGDLYALFVEGALRVLRPGGRAGLIVPLSLLFSRATRGLRDEVLARAGRELRVASFDRIPSGLFEAEVRTRTSILLAGPDAGAARWRATPLVRFTARERPRVFERLRFTDVTAAVHPTLGVPRVGSDLQARGLARLLASGRRLGDAAVARGPARLFFKHNCYAFPIVGAALPPAFDAAGAPTRQTKYSSLAFGDAATRDAALALLAGAWSFWWWLALGDGFDVTGALVQAFPVDPRALPAPARAELARLGAAIQARAARHVAFKRNSGKRIGTFDLRACLDLTAAADDVAARALDAAPLLADVRALLAATHGSAWWTRDGAARPG